MSEWVKVAETDDLEPGEGFETDVEIAGNDIGLFNVDGQYFALGLCTHEDGPLSQGIIEGSTVTCPWHSAKFNIKTGACLSGATACRVDGNVAMDDEEVEELSACMAFEVKVEGDEIFVREKAAT